jgi:hypothetical protein
MNKELRENSPDNLTTNPPQPPIQIQSPQTQSAIFGSQSVTETNTPKTKKHRHWYFILGLYFVLFGIIVFFNDDGDEAWSWITLITIPVFMYAFVHRLYQWTTIERHKGSGFFSFIFFWVGRGLRHEKSSEEKKQDIIFIIAFFIAMSLIVALGVRTFMNSL